MISAASWEISAFSPLMYCSTASNSSVRSHFACRQWHSLYEHCDENYCFNNSWTKSAMLNLVFTCFRLQYVPGKEKQLEVSHFLINACTMYKPTKKITSNISWIGLTSHLGDSGMKNRPSRFSRHGMIPENDVTYKPSLCQYFLIVLTTILD